MGSKHSGSNLQVKGDIRNCSCYRAVKFLEHRIKVVEMVHRIVNVDEMQFGFMLERNN